MPNFAQSEITFLSELKSSIISNGNVNWSGVFYILAAPVGLLACYSSIKLGLLANNDPSKFHIANLYIAISTAALFAMKIPYMLHGKPLALMSFVLNLIGWLIAIIIFLFALNTHSAYKKDKETASNMVKKTL